MDPLYHTMVVGTTEPQDFILYNDDVAFDGTGVTIAIDWRGTDPTGPPSVAWLSAAAGTVRVTGTGTMSVGTSKFRWKLTDSGGTVGFIPNLDYAPNTWRVMSV